MTYQFTAFVGQPSERTRRIDWDVKSWIDAHVRAEAPSGRTSIVSVPGNDTKKNDRRKIDVPTLAFELQGRFQRVIREELLYAYFNHRGVTQPRLGHPNTKPNKDNRRSLVRDAQLVHVPGTLR